MKIKWFLSAAVLLFMIAPPLFAQGNSDIYLSRWIEKGDHVVLTKPVKVSRKKGYNNQPSFHPNGSGVFYVASDGKQTDVFFYNIKMKTNIQLTHTPESEYSPLVMPGGKEFSVIQLINSEGPRKGAQPLVAFPLQGGQPRLIYENGQKVGYHAWIDETQVALFILGRPSTLQVVDLKSGSASIFAYNIGRSIYFTKYITSRELFYIQNIVRETAEGKKKISARWVNYLDPDTGNGRTYFPLLAGNEFFLAVPGGNLAMAVGSGIYIKAPRHSDRWQLAYDLSRYGISKISRIALDPDHKWLAFVSHSK